MLEDKDLGRQAAIAATTLLVSTGLCGLTAIATKQMEYGVSLGLPLGVIELIGMAIGALWLLWILLMILGKFFFSLLSKPKDPQ